MRDSVILLISMCLALPCDHSQVGPASRPSETEGAVSFKQEDDLSDLIDEVDRLLWPPPSTTPAEHAMEAEFDPYVLRDSVLSMIVLEEKLRIWSDHGFIKPGDLNYLLLHLYQRIDGVLPQPARTFRRPLATDQHSASDLLVYKMIGIKLGSLEARAARKAPPKSIRIPPQAFWELVQFFNFWHWEMPGSADELNSFLFG